MAKTYTGGEDDAYMSEDEIIGRIVTTIKNRLGGDAEERFSTLNSVHAFLQEEYTWGSKMSAKPEEGGPLKPPQEENAPLQDKQGALVSQTGILRRCVESKQTRRAFVKAESAELQAECGILHKQVLQLRKGTSFAQKVNKDLETKLQDLCGVEQQYRKLTEEKCVLTEQKKALQDDAAELAKQICQKRATLPQNCLDLEAETHCIRQEIADLQDHVTGLRKELQSEEHMRNQTKQLEADVAVLKTHKRALRDESNRLKSVLLLQAEIKAMCEELESEIKNTQNENRHIEDHITRTIIKVSQASHLEVKLIELREVKEVTQRQKKDLEIYLERLQRQLEIVKAEVPKYEKQIREHDTLREHNDSLQRYINSMKREITKANITADRYKQTIKGGAGLKAKNKALSKEVQKLKKTVLKLESAEEAHVQKQQATDGLTKENCRLHKEIYSLQEEITCKKVLEARIKTLATEEKSLIATNDYKRMLIEYLQEMKQEQQPLQEKIRYFGERIEFLQLDEQRLQKKLEGIAVDVHTHEVKKVLLRALAYEGNALKTGIKGVTLKIQQASGIAMT